VRAAWRNSEEVTLGRKHREDAGRPEPSLLRAPPGCFQRNRGDAERDFSRRVRVKAFSLNEASMVGNEASMVQNEASMVQNEASMVRNEASMVRNEASMVRNEASMVRNEASMLRNVASIVLMRFHAEPRRRGEQLFSAPPRLRVKPFPYGQLSA
jgi:hypothetical protein